MKRQPQKPTGKPDKSINPDELSQVSGGSHERRDRSRPRHVDEARIRHRQGSSE
ncbi:hypothetical protein [Legionella taurinensis]|uniref:hypothetical protein n=1 Tax=Legionella taurinensis TaxID=70611 RepID=UPI000DFD8D83|nr:hypothetical protein [Legionella taurinensis]MDX1837555.1 hypothetical protein [Legionella taurinensis]STY25473.1 Uncharacterised protein [Legionella taurinensis]